MKNLAIIILMFVSFSSHGTTYIRQSVSTYFDNSEIVARVLVQKAELLESEYEGKEVSCGVQISAKVIESFKGDSQTVDFFIEGMVLNPAVEYLVFLEGPSSKDVTPITSTNSMMQSEAYIRSKACSEFYTGFKANWLNISRFMRTWSRKRKQFEDWVTPGYNVQLASEENLARQSITVHSLMVDGKEVEINGVRSFLATLRLLC